MRLLYITNAINGSGGLERVLSIKTSYFVDNMEYEVDIITLNSLGASLFYSFSSKIKLHDINVSGNVFKYIFNYIKGICSTVNNTKPDVVLVCDDGLKGFFIPYLIPKSTPVIYERHVSKEIEIQHDYSFFKKKLIKVKWLLMDFLAKKFNAFVVLTEGNLKEWISLKNITVISNPLSFYPETPSNLENKKVIVVGKQSYQKGYDLLLEAWKLVIEKHPDWHLDIYGKKDYAMKLDELAIELSLMDTLAFHEPEKEIQQKYLESSIYVMSSRYEGFGMVLIEAMACGLPCVSFNCNYGPSDIITDGIDGYVVEKQDCDALASKIINLIEDGYLRKKMGLVARENVKRYLSIHILDQWDVLFKSLLK